MALVEFNRDPTPRDVRRFAFVWLPAACLVLGGLAAFRYHAFAATGVLLTVALAGIALGVVVPRAMRALLVGWMAAAFPVGWLIAHLAMAAIYFLLITPMALVMRVARRDPLARRFDPSASTYWVARRRQSDPARYFRQF